MPDLVFPYTELTTALQAKLAVSGNKLSMFVNNVTPDKSSTFATFSLANDPVTASPITWTLTSGSWTYTNDAFGVMAKHAQLGMVVNGPLSLYGYLVYTSANVLIYAQRFDSAPFPLVTGLNPLVIVPEVHCDSPG